MKKLTSLVAMLMMVSTSAFAQFANAGASSTSSAADTEGWQGITVSYDKTSLTYDFEDAKDTDLDGFSVGYVKAFSISNDLPLFLEAGVKFSYASGEESISEEFYYDGYYYEAGLKNEFTYYGLQIPINLAYKFAVNDEIQIIPFTGLYLKGNLAAKVKQTLSLDGYELESASYDLFDKEDADELDYDDTWNRFNFGWQIGAKVAYKQFTAGISYGLDLNEIGEKTKVNNFSISVGYNF